MKLRGVKANQPTASSGLSSLFGRFLRVRAHAFTLLELLVVIGIISILLVTVIPAVTSLSKSSGRKGAVSNLLGAIEQARAQAIKDGQATYVVFPTSARAPRRRFWIVTTTDPTRLSRMIYPPRSTNTAKEADLFTQAVINSRPFLSSAQLQTITNGNGPFFGNPRQWSGETASGTSSAQPTEWNDSGREELFSKCSISPQSVVAISLSSSPVNRWIKPAKSFPR